MAVIRWTEKEEKLGQKLKKAMDDAVEKSAEAFEQLIEVAGQDPREVVKARARYTIEECRINYDQALQLLRRMEDDKRNDRLEAIAQSSKIATWVAVPVALASLVVSLIALLK